MSASSAPDGTYLVEVDCFKCGQRMQTFTDANMSDPEIAAMVLQLQSMTLCEQCARETGNRNARNSFLVIWGDELLETLKHHETNTTENHEGDGWHVLKI